MRRVRLLHFLHLPSEASLINDTVADTNAAQILPMAEKENPQTFLFLANTQMETRKAHMARGRDKKASLARCG